MKKKLRFWLYRFGLYLVRRYADHDALESELLRTATLSQTHIDRVAVDHGAAVPESETVARNLTRVVGEIANDVPGASLASIHDRSVKALVRLHPEITAIEHAKMVFGEMRRNGLV